MKTKITNLKGLTEDLVTSYEELRERKITITEAQAMTKQAQGIMVGLKLQLAYNQFTKSKKKIEFLEL